ncbi:MAG: hypothetical protein O7F17_07135, partial [Planctomycetota bacterium]|nr:hypothetical protein [Planctomycetota bacterium]
MNNPVPAIHNVVELFANPIGVQTAPREGHLYLSRKSSSAQQLECLFDLVPALKRLRVEQVLDSLADLI